MCHLLRSTGAFRSRSKVHRLRTKICWNMRFQIAKTITQILKRCILKKGIFQISFFQFHNSISFRARDSERSHLTQNYSQIVTKWNLSIDRDTFFAYKQSFWNSFHFWKWCSGSTIDLLKNVNGSHLFLFSLYIKNTWFSCFLRHNNAVYSFFNSHNSISFWAENRRAHICHKIAHRLSQSGTLR